MKTFLQRIKFFSKKDHFNWFNCHVHLSIFLQLLKLLSASITTLVSILSSGENYLFEGFISKEINLNFNLILIVIFLIFLIKSFL